MLVCNPYVEFYFLLIIICFTVPGDLGSQIEGKINKLTAPHFFCDKHSDWFTLWVNDKLIVPGYDECFVENAK